MLSAGGAMQQRAGEDHKSKRRAKRKVTVNQKLGFENDNLCKYFRRRRRHSPVAHNLSRELYVAAAALSAELAERD